MGLVLGIILLLIGITSFVMGLRLTYVNLKLLKSRDRIRLNSWYVIDIPKYEPDTIIIRNASKDFFYCIEGRTKLHVIQKEAYQILGDLLQNNCRLKAIKTIKAGSFVIDYERFKMGEVKKIPLMQLGKKEKRDLIFNQCILAARNKYNWRKGNRHNITKSFTAVSISEWIIGREEFILKFSLSDYGSSKNVG